MGEAKKPSHATVPLTTPAQMHQNTFSTTLDTKKYLFQGHVSKIKCFELAFSEGV